MMVGMPHLPSLRRLGTETASGQCVDGTMFLVHIKACWKEPRCHEDTSLETEGLHGRKVRVSESFICGFGSVFLANGAATVSASPKLKAGVPPYRRLGGRSINFEITLLRGKTDHIKETSHPISFTRSISSSVLI